MTGEKLNISPNSTRSSDEAMSLAQQNVSTTAFNVKVTIKKGADGTEVVEFLNKDGTPFIAQPVAPAQQPKPPAADKGLAI